MSLLPAEHEFGARHGGIRHLLDAFGLPVEFDGHGVRRFSGGIRGRAEIGDLAFERDTGGLERAFGGFDVRFELRSPAGDLFAGAGSRVAETSGQTIQPLASILPLT